MNSAQLDVQALAVRIEKLEAANRRWKSASVLALLFVISILLLSTRHAERVAAAAKADRAPSSSFIKRAIRPSMKGRLKFRLSDAPNVVSGFWPDAIKACFAAAPSRSAIAQPKSSGQS